MQVVPGIIEDSMQASQHVSGTPTVPSTVGGPAASHSQHISTSSDISSGKNEIDLHGVPTTTHPDTTTEPTLTRGAQLLASSATSNPTDMVTADVDSIATQAVTTVNSAGSAMQTPPFLTKLYQLVSDPSTTELVSWTDVDGLSFTVHKPSDFGRDVLPKYFKHNNFSSFVRQLNQYGFHKQNPDKWMFGHENFRKGRPDLLKSISRRRPKHLPQQQTSDQPPASISTAVVAPQHSLTQNRAVLELGKYGLDLEGEVKALQRDKDLLIKELVVTRQAEEKLKSTCEALEARMQAMEVTTKQMQAFIVHYFSQVLHPYSQAVASRKRKRITSGNSQDGAMEIDQEGSSDESTSGKDDTGNGPPMDVVKANAPGMSMGIGGNGSMDALRILMQQMGMNVGLGLPPDHGDGHHRRPASRTRAIENVPAGEDRLALTLDPATVQEISEAAAEDNRGEMTRQLSGFGGGLINTVHNASGQRVANGHANGGVTVDPKHGNSMGLPNGALPEVNQPGLGNEKDISLDFFDDLGPSAGTSLTMDIFEHALDSSNNTADHPKASGSATNILSTNNLGDGDIPMDMTMYNDFGNTNFSDDKKENNVDMEQNPMQYAVDRRNVTDNVEGSNGGIVGDDEADQTIEHLLNLDATALPHPLSHLPIGTDVQALARRIEKLTGDIP